MRIPSLILYLSISLISSFFSSLLDLKVFKPWVQVQELWDSQVNIIALIFAGHMHLPRYLVVYPGFHFEDHLPGLGFSIYISLFFAINLYMFSGILNKVSHGFRRNFFLIAFACVHLVMNGRGVIAWSGWLIACNIFLNVIPPQYHKLRPFLFPFSLLFASVSTGVFIINAIALLVFFFRRFQLSYFLKFRARILLLLISFLPFTLWSINYFVSALNKNIDFYGGGTEGALAMLDHGYGSVFDPSLPEVLLAISIVGLFFASLRYFGFRYVISPLNFLILLAMLGGLFGYTVLTLVLIPLFLRLSTTNNKSIPFKPTSNYYF